MRSNNAHGESPTRLGRGLAALLEDIAADVVPAEHAAGLTKLPIENLRPSKHNPRKTFDEAEIDGLASSIRTRGILQPILVRLSGHDAGIFEIIAGERRWRAAQRAGVYEVPVIVLTLSDRESLEVALIENVQRADLNPLDEAAGYNSLILEHEYTHEEVANIVGRSRSHISNTIRLLGLPDRTRILLAQGELSAGHARALLAASEPDTVAAKVVKDGLTVRDVERWVSAEKNRSGVRKKGHAAADVDIKSWQKQLQLILGVEVKVRATKKGGDLVLRFSNFEQLQELFRRLSQ